MTHALTAHACSALVNLDRGCFPVECIRVARRKGFCLTARNRTIATANVDFIVGITEASSRTTFGKQIRGGFPLATTYLELAGGSYVLTCVPIIVDIVHNATDSDLIQDRTGRLRGDRLLRSLRSEDACEQASNNEIDSGHAVTKSNKLAAL